MQKDIRRSVFDAVKKRVPGYTVALDDDEYLAYMEQKATVNVKHFSSWLSKKHNAAEILAEGGLFLLVECYDDHHPIFPRANQ